MNIQLIQQDIEFLLNYLFEHETPLTARELVSVFLEEHIGAQRLAMQRQREAVGKAYQPKDSYQVGDDILFPALDWRHGKVTGVRAGVNPEIGNSDVLTVDMDGEAERLFASNLQTHSLNDQPVTIEENEYNLEEIQRTYGEAIEKKIEAAFQQGDEIVRIAGRWFPRALLVDVNIGHLNLAEAVLDEAGGQPMSTTALAEQVDLPVSLESG